MTIARRYLLPVALLISLFILPGSADPTVREAIVGDAVLNEGAYQMLQKISDRFGPRMVGTAANRQTIDWLEAELKALGLNTRREPFTFPGWIRGKDQVTLLAPIERPLRPAALGYVNPHPPFEADVAYVASAKEMDPTVLHGKVALLAPNLSFNADDQRYLAEEVGVKGLLLTNRVNGGQLLARVGTRDGSPTPFPMYSLTEEEGRWMKRLLADGETVRVRIETGSRVAEMTVDNLVAELPGTSGKRVVVGAHIDSWDLGQGAMDNGLGVAQVYEIARLLKRHSPQNRHTVELVWFNAEELGLWGSQRYVERHKGDLDDIHVMINLDMAGRPIGINAMGFDELVPVLKRTTEQLGSWRFERSVENKTWLGSDHHPFIVEGVPGVTFNAPIDPDDVRYYHDFGDTFDKVDREMLGRAAALIALTTYDLANDDTSLRRYTPEEAAALFRKAGLEDRMRQGGQWPFE